MGIHGPFNGELSIALPTSNKKYFMVGDMSTWCGSDLVWDFHRRRALFGDIRYLTFLWWLWMVVGVFKRVTSYLGSLAGTKSTMLVWRIHYFQRLQTLSEGARG